MKKFVELGQKKVCKFVFSMFVVLMFSSITTAIIGFAEGETMKANGYDSWITKNATTKSWWADILRNIGFKILLFLAWLVNNFDKAIDDLLAINLYTLIKNAFNIKSQIYPIATAVASAALIFAVIMLFLNADKARISDFLRNILCSAMLIVALPALTATMTDLKTAGTDYAQNVMDDYSDFGVDAETGIVDKVQLGDRILMQEVYDMGESIDNNKPMHVEGFKKAESISINVPLDNDYYDKKPMEDGVYTNPELVSLQTNYKDLSEIEKFKLIDRAAAKQYNTFNGIKTDPGIYDYITSWESYSDDTIMSYGNQYYAKKGGKFYKNSLNNSIYCRVEPFGNKWNPKCQIFQEDVTGEIIVYVDEISEDAENAKMEKNGGILDRDDYKELHQRTIKWGTDWLQGVALGWDEAKQYQMRGDIYNYQVYLCKKLSEEFSYSSNIYTHLPPNAKSVFNFNWIYNNIVCASSVTEALTALESQKIEYNGIKLSVMEWLNVEENKAVYDAIAEEEEYLSHSWVPLRKFEPESTNDLFAALIEIMGTEYYNESLYKYHFDFLKSFVMLFITGVCLVFAGFKIASLMFDVLFAQIVAPIALATDMTGSGRGKQVLMNLLGCNICYIVVIFILRLYLTVLNALYEQNYSFLVVVFITFAGAKFVIDGPDLIVKLTGIDAGVKSGLNTIMGLRSAAQLTKGAVQGAVGLAKTPSKIAGAVGRGVGKAAAEVKSISNSVKNAEGAAGKTAAVAGAVLGHAPVLSSARKGFKGGYSENARAIQDYNNAKSIMDSGESSTAVPNDSSKVIGGNTGNSVSGASSSGSGASERSSGESNNSSSESMGGSSPTRRQMNDRVNNSGDGKRGLDPRTVQRERHKPIDETNTAVPNGTSNTDSNTAASTAATPSTAGGKAVSGNADVRFFGEDANGNLVSAVDDGSGNFVSNSGKPLSNVKGYSGTGNSGKLNMAAVSSTGGLTPVKGANGGYIDNDGNLYNESQIIAYGGSGFASGGLSVKGIDGAGNLVDACPDSSGGFTDSSGGALQNVGVYTSRGKMMSSVMKPVVTSAQTAGFSSAPVSSDAPTASYSAPVQTAYSAPAETPGGGIFTSGSSSSTSPIDEAYFSEAYTDSSYADFDPFGDAGASSGGFYDPSDFTGSKTNLNRTKPADSKKPRQKFDPNMKKPKN